MATAYHLEALRRQRILERAAEAKERMEAETAAAGARVEEAKEKRKQNRHHHHKRSNRPASAQKISSSPKKSKTGHSPSPTVSEKASNKMETSPRPLAPAEAGKSSHSSTASKSVTGSRPVSLHSSDKPRVRGTRHSTASTTTTTPGQSRACSSNGEAISGTETIVVSRCSKCHSIVSSTYPPQPQPQEKDQQSSSRASAGGGRASSTKSATSVQSGSTRGSSTLASERGRALKKTVELKADAVRKDLHQQELLLRDNNLVMGNIPVDEEMKLRTLEQQKLPN